MQIQNEKQIYKNSQNSYEEINEKKTSVLGYILLIIMVIFVIGVGETIFSDLKEIPKKPTRPSSCIQNSITDLENLTNLNCPSFTNTFLTFNEIDRKFELDTKFNTIKSELQEIASLNETINSHERKIRNLENNIQELNKNYDLGLQEKMANEDPIMDTPGTQFQITNSRSQINTLESDISSSESKRITIISQISPSIKSLEQSYEEAFDHYLTNNA
jgi:DNA repair exonuclease SbcCD ATPase subunit